MGGIISLEYLLPVVLPHSLYFGLEQFSCPASFT